MKKEYEPTTEEMKDAIEAEYGKGMFYDDKEIRFYYRCMRLGMSILDSDKYAMLNTLFGYDVGVENARKINEYLWRRYRIILDYSYKDKSDLIQAAKDLNLQMNFDNWIQYEPKVFHYFE